MSLNMMQLKILKSKSQGSALIMAVFVILVMTVLGAALMRILSSSSESVAYEVLGTRAFAAAQTGVQWQLQQVFPLGAAAVACPGQAFIDANKPVITNTIGLNNCQISELSCADFVHDGIRYYQVTSTGQCDINGEVTSRTVEVQARSLD